MSDIAIRVEGLSKEYQIGAAQGRYQTFREAILRAASAPMRWAKGERPDPTTIWALNDVSFEVKQGEVIGVIGRNGAGKSTLLKILSRITKPTRGRVELNGRVGSLLEVGTGFHPELTGRENVFLNGAILGMTRREIQRKFDEIVDFSGVEKFIDTPVKHYSSGMQVRLAFSVAAHLEPEILLVDEVLAVGDAEFQKKSLGKMDEVSKTGRTVLFVSHNMGAIVHLCRKTILLEQSKLKHFGPTNETVNLYLSNIHEGNNKFQREDTPNSQAYYRNLIFADSSGNEISHAVSGQPINIILDYEAESDNLSLEFAIGIYNISGEKLLHLGTFYKPFNPSIIPKKGKAICSIPKLTLVEGKYYLNILLKNGNQHLDHIVQAATLNVEKGDFYGTGKVPSAQENYFLIDHSWEINFE